MAVVIGITGGIATGKTTVLQMFSELGVETASADQIAREVLSRGEPAILEAIREFGSDIVGPDGEIDRKKLGDRIFTNPELREKLNRIMHPRIIARIEQIVSEFRGKWGEETDAVMAIEIPLLFECGLENMVDKVVVVAAEQDTVLNRLMSRDRLSMEAAKERVLAQTPLSEKIARADQVIWTDQDILNIKERVSRVFRWIAEKRNQNNPAD